MVVNITGFVQFINSVYKIISFFPRIVQMFNSHFFAALLPLSSSIRVFFPTSVSSIFFLLFWFCIALHVFVWLFVTLLCIHLISHFFFRFELVGSFQFVGTFCARADLSTDIHTYRIEICFMHVFVCEK